VETATDAPAVRAWGRGPRRRALAYAIAVVLLAFLLWGVYGPAEVGYDARFSLVWGHELGHLQSADYGAQLSPTSHPLANLLGFVASLFGRSGPGVLAALSFVALSGLGVAAFAIGTRSFGAVTGVAFAAILLTRPLLVGETLDSSIDIPFLALVLAALALELGRPRRGAPVLIALALAGLLRPEAWLLSVAYLAYVIPSRPRAAWRHLGALALAAPLIWCVVDLVTTGAPFHSLTTTQDLAGTLQRERGVASAFADTPVNLQAILGSEIAWAGLAAAAVALMVVPERVTVPVATLATGLLGFIALGVADLPLLTRYLLVPSSMLALFCAAGVGAFQWLGPGRRRLAGWAVAVGAAAALLGNASATRGGIDFNRERVADDRSMRAALVDLTDVARSRGLAGCAPVQAATHRAIPLLAYGLGRRPSQIHVVLPVHARSGLLFAAPPATLVGDVGLLPGVTIRSQELVPPRSFQRIASNRWWTLAARC
jgi:hypothetical protein